MDVERSLQQRTKEVPNMSRTDQLILRLDQYASATRLRTAARRDAVAALDAARCELSWPEVIEVEQLLGIAS
jgi:hypothetical protein